MAATFLACVLIFRGLYDLVPFLMSLALGGIGAWGMVMALRLFTRRDVRIGRSQLKRAGRITAAGAGFAVFALALLAFTAHSAVMRACDVTGRNRLVQALPQGLATPAEDVNAAALAQATKRLMVIERFGLWRSLEHSERLAAALIWSDRPREARTVIERLLASQPGRHDWRLRLAGVLLAQGRLAESVAHLRAITAWTDGAQDAASLTIGASAHQMLGEIAAALGDDAAAAVEFQAVRRLRAK
jgi:hypothetical protein